MRKLHAAPAVCAAAIATVGLIVSGCGGKSTTATVAAASVNSGNGAAATAKARQMVASFSAPATSWPAPPGPIKPGAGRLAILSCGQAGADCNAASKDAVEAIRAAGWTPSAVFDGQFSPQAQAAAIQTAVNQGYNGIVIIATDVNSIKGAVDNAIAKHVAISCVLCYSGAYRGKGVDDATPDFYKEGVKLGWALIERSGGKGKILAFDDAAYPQVGQRLGTAKQTLVANCPNCSWQQETIPTTDLTKPGPPTFTAALAAHPEGTMSDVVAPYDLFSVPMAKTLQQAGRSDVTVSGFDATAEMLQAMSTGQLPVGVTVGSPYEYATWSAVDLAIRRVRNLPSWSATDLPSILITKANAGQYVGRYYGPSYDFKAKFKALWGRS